MTDTTYVLDADADDLDAQRPADLSPGAWLDITGSIVTARCMGSRGCTVHDREGREWRARRTEQPGALYVVEQVQP